MKKAFTMAEILITIAVIGVVFALTLPMLIAKYQLKLFETAFKKQYSVIQNAIEYSTISNSYQGCYVYFRSGDIGYSFEKSDCEALKKDLVEILKLKPVSSKVLKNYKKKAEIHSAGGESVNWACSYDNFVNFNPYVLPDGAIVAIIAGNHVPMLFLDVNGEKGPNKFGYDAFFMMFTNHNEKTSKILLTDEYCSIIEKGGRFPRTILQNNSKSNGRYNYTW